MSTQGLWIHMTNRLHERSIFSRGIVPTRTPTAYTTFHVALPIYIIRTPQQVNNNKERNRICERCM